MSEDAGGRSLIFSIHSVESDSTESLDLVESIPGVFLNLAGLQNAPNFNAAFCGPIREAKVATLIKNDAHTGASNISRNRYTGSTKPVYVLADVIRDHIGTGESTNASTETQNLAEIIRNRGLGSSNDDCGHIIGKQYGGKMVDYNLFPQDKHINRGLGVYSYIWRWGVELLVRIWLISQAPYDPMVRIRILLFYPNSSANKPDRPTSFQYHYQFYKRKIEKKSKQSDNESHANATALKLFIGAAIHGEVPNECLKIDEKYTKESMVAFREHLRRLEKMTKVSELREMLRIYIAEIANFGNPPPVPSTSTSRPPMSANKPFSWWDIVPFVGSLRTLDDCFECAKDGDGLGATVNGALGIGGLALDILSLGTISAFANAAKSAVTEGTKVVAKQGAKMAIKQGTLIAVEKVFIIAVTEMAKEGIIALAQTAVTQAARRAVEAIAENVQQ